MTPRERLAALAMGARPDRRPAIAFASSQNADAVCVKPDQINQELQAGDRAVLAVVLSPLAKAIERGVPLIQELAGQDHSGLDQLTKETKEEMASALTRGADGVAYVIDGASPAHTTPMEYGGFFLETDRALLNEAVGAHFNLIYVKGENDPYIDFVSDLPAHGFAWEADVDPAEVRALRKGAIMGEDFTLLRKEAVVRL